MNKIISRVYDKEFKLNAVKLYLGKDVSYRKLREEIGVPESTLAGWVEEYQKSGAESFPGKGYLKPEDTELARLHKELSVVREERDILKKALGIFSSVRK